jgi:hypothetical protein
LLTDRRRVVKATSELRNTRDLSVRAQRTAHETDFLRVMEVVKRVIEGVVKFVTEHPIICP